MAALPFSAAAAFPDIVCSISYFLLSCSQIRLLHIGWKKKKLYISVQLSKRIYKLLKKWVSPIRTHPCKGWLKSIFSSSHDSQQTHLPAIRPAARLRRTSVLPQAKPWRRGNSLAPSIFNHRRVEPPSGRRNPKKKDICFQQMSFFFGPSDWIRTSGLLNPIQARYQTSPHPEIAAVFQTA